MKRFLPRGFSVGDKQIRWGYKGVESQNVIIRTPSIKCDDRAGPTPSEMIAQYYDTYREIVIRSDLQVENERITRGNNLM
jgi:hypothetical protein